MPDLLHALLTQRDAAPCARVLAALHLVLGRPPRLGESGLSRASFYRHRADAERMIRAQNEKSQATSAVLKMSTGDQSETVIHRTTELSTDRSTDSAQRISSRDQALGAQGARKSQLSTARRGRVNNKSRKEAPDDVPLIQCEEARAVKALRERHALASAKHPHLPRLVLDGEALRSLRSALNASGLDYVLSVAEKALLDACAGTIPAAWYARMWHGAGYDARASAHDAVRQKTSKAHEPVALCEETIATLRSCGVKIA